MYRTYAFKALDICELFRYHLDRFYEAIDTDIPPIDATVGAFLLYIFYEWYLA